MAAPPSDAGAVQVTVAWPSPAVATTLVGASGATEATACVAVDARPPPTSAMTRAPTRHRCRQALVVPLLLLRLLLMSLSRPSPCVHEGAVCACNGLDPCRRTTTRPCCCRPGSTVWGRPRS
ncbi:hypothetical protein ASG70_06875 [Phycicoccus sp. Soil748]|nr:hypothetical protein ASG70_06875 [Phycicoccus sp. Soil748]